MKFQDFRATARHVDCLLAATLNDWIDPDQPGIVYHGNTTIDKNADGTYTLTIYNDSRTSANLLELEAHLYAWVVTEFGEEWGISEPATKFISSMYAYNPDAYVKAFIENVAASPICTMHDFCDANQFALDAVGDDLDAAFEVYDEAKPYLSAN